MLIEAEDRAAIRAAQDRCALEAHAKLGAEPGQAEHEEALELGRGRRVLVRASVQIVRSPPNGAGRRAVEQ
jgi:hypothetical protein